MGAGAMQKAFSTLYRVVAILGRASAVEAKPKNHGTWKTDPDDEQSS